MRNKGLEHLVCPILAGLSPQLPVDVLWYRVDAEEYSLGDQQRDSPSDELARKAHLMPPVPVKMLLNDGIDLGHEGLDAVLDQRRILPLFLLLLDCSNVKLEGFL